MEVIINSKHKMTDKHKTNNLVNKKIEIKRVQGKQVEKVEQSQKQ